MFFILESWVELSGGITPPVESQFVYGGNLEKLLIEAQRESRSSSRPNSKESSARGRFVITETLIIYAVISSVAVKAFI